MSDINFNSGSVSGSMTSFQTNLNKMVDLFEKIKADTNSIEGYWQGTSANEVTEGLNALTSAISQIEEQNKKYITFLSNACESYSKTDDKLNTSASSDGLDV